MKKIISEQDIKKANNIERCKLLIEIIKGQAMYIQDINIHKGVMNYE